MRLQSDERLIAHVRRGNTFAFEVLVSRYHARLLGFCRHLLGSREDAEDVLQEVLAAAFNAMVADERPINARPWLYRIARNRCLNHLRRATAIGVDSMDVHFSDHGASTADKVHEAEEFRLLIGDIHCLPETQRTALVLREMDALSYEQIAEAMETTIPSVKSLLVRARMSLAEVSEARLLSCEEVRIELAEVAEGLLAKGSAPVRRHIKACRRCTTYRDELKRTSKALRALLPLGPMAVLKKTLFIHLSHSAGAGSSASGAGATGAAVGSGAAAGGVMMGAGASSMVPIGVGAVASKAVAGLAAAALVTAGAVDLTHGPRRHAAPAHVQVGQRAAITEVDAVQSSLVVTAPPARSARAKSRSHAVHHTTVAVLAKPATSTTTTVKPTALKPAAVTPQPVGRTQTDPIRTVLPTPASATGSAPGAVDQSGMPTTAGLAASDNGPATSTTSTPDPNGSSTAPSDTTGATGIATPPATTSSGGTSDQGQGATASSGSSSQSAGVTGVTGATGTTGAAGTTGSSGPAPSAVTGAPASNSQ